MQEELNKNRDQKKFHQTNRIESRLIDSSSNHIRNVIV